MKNMDVILIDYQEFEAIVDLCLNLPRKYEFVAEEEAHNDTFHLFFNTEKRDDWYQEVGEQQIEDYRQGKRRQVWARDLIDELVHYEILEPANYLIWVTW